MTRGVRMAGEAAFTLLEVLIAVAIMAMISALLWYSFHQTFQTIDMVRADADMLRQARQVTSRVPNELASAFLPTIVSLTSNVKYEFVGEDDGETDRVRFVSMSHTKLYQDANESDQSEVEYYTEDDPRHAGLNRIVRREDSVIDDEPDEGGSTVIIAEKVKSFELEYYDANKDSWTGDWDTTRVEHNARLPYAVRMRLTLVDSDGMDRTWVTATTVRLAKVTEQR